MFPGYRTAFLRAATRNCSPWVGPTAAVGVVAALTGSVGSHNAAALEQEESSTKERFRNQTLLKRRMTSIGHFSILSETVHNPSIVTFVMTLESRKDDPWTVDKFRDLWHSAGMPERHPRFHLVAHSEEDGLFADPAASGGDNGDDGNNMDLHVSESLPPIRSRSDIIQRIKTLITEPWDLKERLWHIYIVPWTKIGAAGTTPTEPASKNDDSTEIAGATVDGESLLIFQGHHVLADGASMAAAMIDLGDEASQIRAAIEREIELRGFGRHSPWWKRLYRQFLFVLWLLTGTLQSAWYQFKLYVWNAFGPISPWYVLEQLYYEDHDNSKPERSISFASVGSVEQAKWVARTLAGRRATVNDVFCAALSRALARQLEWHRQRLSASFPGQENLLPPLPKMNLAVPVHLKGGVIMPGESVSNSLGAFCVRLPCENDALSSEHRLKQVHKELALVKQRPTAFVSHYIAKLSTQLLPSSWVSYLYERSGAGASCVVTNVRGLEQPIHMRGSKVKSIYGFVPLPSGIPVGLVVHSHHGKIQMTLTAQPWAVPDADRFLTWIMEEYMNLVQEAETKTSLANKR